MAVVWMRGKYLPGSAIAKNCGKRAAAATVVEKIFFLEVASLISEMYETRIGENIRFRNLNE